MFQDVDNDILVVHWIILAFESNGFDFEAGDRPMVMGGAVIDIMGMGDNMPKGLVAVFLVGETKILVFGTTEKGSEFVHGAESVDFLAKADF